MFRIQSVAAALMVVSGLSVPVVADDPNPEPEYKTSTGRELNGPSTHHGEYTASSSDTVRPRLDTVQDPAVPVPPSKRRTGAGAPVPGVDDKSSTRPGE